MFQLRLDFSFHRHEAFAQHRKKAPQAPVFCGSRLSVSWALVHDSHACSIVRKLQACGKRQNATRSSMGFHGCVAASVAVRSGETSERLHLWPFRPPNPSASLADLLSSAGNTHCSSQDGELCTCDASTKHETYTCCDCTFRRSTDTKQPRPNEEYSTSARGSSVRKLASSPEATDAYGRMPHAMFS